MKQLRIVFVSIAALVSAIPGYQSIRDSVGTPPDYGSLFGGTQVAVSALIILAIFLFRAELLRISRGRLVRLSAGAAAVFIVSLSLYLVCLNLCKVYVENETPGKPPQAYYFPLVPGGDLAKAIDQSSRQEVANRYRRGLHDILPQQGIRLTGTTIVLLLLHVTTFAALAAAFCLLGIRVGALHLKPNSPQRTLRSK